MFHPTNCPTIRRVRTAFVYVIEDGDEHCKVGHSLNPSRRLSTLSGASPYGLSLALKVAVPVEQARAVERRAHAYLRPWIVAGEWFRVSRDLARTAVLAAADASGDELFCALAAFEAMLRRDTDDFQAIHVKAVEIERRWSGTLDQVNSFHSWWALPANACMPEPALPRKGRHASQVEREARV